MPEVLAALVAGLAANPLETVAAGFGIVSVWLSTREHVASWPTGMVNVALYFLVFHGAKLYADMWLQAIYFALSVYGWYEWKYGGEQRSALRVSRATARHWTVVAVVGTVGSAALGHFFARRTDAAMPYLDSTLSVVSLLAQWMMTRKLVENWAVWVALDLVYVAMFLSRGLYPTALQYAVFLGLAAKGFFDWRRTWLARASS